MRSLFGIVIMVVLFNESVGQSDSIYYQIIKPESRIQYFTLNEGKMISQLNLGLIPFNERQMRNKLIQIDNKEIDSTGYQLESFPRVIGSHLVGTNRVTRLLSEISERGITSIPIHDITNHWMATLSNYYSIQSTGKIYVLNEKLVPEFVVDLSKAICNVPPCQGFDATEVVNHIFEFNDSTLFIRTCLWDFGCQYANYYLVNRVKNSVHTVTDIIKRHVEINCKEAEETEIWLSSKNGKYYRVLKEKTSSQCDDKLEMGDYVMDSEFNLVSSYSLWAKLKWSITTTILRLQESHLTIMVG
jgi:hypothetical protein